MDTKTQLVEGIQAEIELNKKLKKRYYQDHLYEFQAEVLGWKDISDPVHRPLCNFITDNVRKKQVLIEMPRGTFKSSIGTVGYTLWKIVNNQDIRILIVNATYPLVANFISQIQDHLKKNQKLIDIYGDLSKESEIWNENTIKLKTPTSYERKEPTVFGFGMQGNLVSTHVNIIILDDLVNWDNVATKDQVDKVISFYKSTQDILEPHGELIIFGTPYAYADLYAWIENKENAVHREFAIYKKPAWEGEWLEGKLLFPERLDWDRLKRLKKIEGPSHFASQYALKPILPEDAKFKPHYFRYYEPENLKGLDLLTFMTVDPAMSLQKEADYTALVVLSVDKQNNWYIRDIVQGRFGTPSELIREMMSLDDRWKPKTIGIETVAFQKAISSFLKDEVRSRRMEPLPIKDLKPETSRATGLSEPKQYRIESLEPRYASGMIFHNKDMRFNDVLEDQLMRFPKNDHDDIIDALAYMEQIAFPVRKREQRGDMEMKGENYLY